MKYSALFILASVVCTPLYAAEDNCTAKIDSLESIYKIDGAGISGGKVEEFRALLEKAKEAQKSGDAQTCNTSADRAKQIYDSARSK